MLSIQPHHRLAILLHDGILGGHGKTGLAMVRYSESPIAAVIDRACVGQSFPELTGIPRAVPIVGSMSDALSHQPDILAIGIALLGGQLPEDWYQDIQTAIAAGLSVVNGLHTSLADNPRLQALLKPGQWIWDVRKEPPNLPVGSASARSLTCRRVLTVGTDMAIGKMSTSLELHKAGLRRGLKSKFLATGQAGIMISGAGMPLDAIRVDFAAGAVEQLVMQFGHDHEILHIEGQGSFCHPASTATLPLIRGAQPTHLVLVHRAGQIHNRRYEDIPIPSLSSVIAMYESVASCGGIFSAPNVVAIALNTAHLRDEEAKEAIAQVKSETQLPCSDVVRYGADSLLDAILE